VTSAWAWEPALISRATHLVGRPILRPGAADARLPEEALLVGVDFDGIDAASVQLERPGIAAADSTYALPQGLSSLDFVTGVPLGTITGIRVSKKGDDPASGSLTLRCTLYGRQFETPRLMVSLGQGTGLGRVARLESDRADRQKVRVAGEMYRSGQYTVAAIATTLGVSRASIYRHLTSPSAD
jgi:Helix-turn-helix domain of resolvase